MRSEQMVSRTDIAEQGTLGYVSTLVFTLSQMKGHLNRGAD